LAFATFLVWRLRTGVCGVGALVVFCAYDSYPFQTHTFYSSLLHPFQAAGRANLSRCRPWRRPSTWQTISSHSLKKPDLMGVVNILSRTPTCLQRVGIRFRRRYNKTAAATAARVAKPTVADATTSARIFQIHCNSSTRLQRLSTQSMPLLFPR